jgi:hypothetical protein
LFVQLKQLKNPKLEDKKMVFKSTLTWQREERIAAEAKAAEEAKKKSSKKSKE